MAKIKFKAYHGTDASVVNDILKNGFIYKPNDEHWLGDGIYFFLDENLAEWWTTNPTKKSGMHIQDPAIIECTIEIEEEHLLDLRNLKNYTNYVDLYNSFFREWAFRARDEKVNFNQIRCAFFNYISKVYSVDAIIAPFIVPEQPYMPQYRDTKYADEMRIMYTEIQLCINKSQSVIKTKEAHVLSREVLK